MNAGARRWHEEFLDELTTVNLRRQWIVTLVSTALAAATLVLELATSGWSNSSRVGTTDVSFSFGVMAGLFWMRRRPRTGRWPRMVIAALAVMWLISLDSYYFTAFAAGTHNASYAIGVMCVALLFLLPPRVILPLFALNHAFYCLRLLQFAHDGRKVLAPLIDGTVCVTLAGLAAWFLYQGARGNFLKERTIAERNRELADSNAELREVMAIAAHDLRTPLLGVKNLLDLTAVQPALAREQWNAVANEASRTCGDMLRLVTRLLAAHEAEHAREREPVQPEDLRAHCQAAAQRARRLGDPKAVAVTLTLPDHPALASVQVDALADVLDNLLGNAVKFSARDTAVELALAPADRAWHIEVRDQGPGVPEAERTHLFKKFRRGSAVPTGEESSTGLGLFIVKTLTETMGGTVSHAPRPPRGSTFRVELPVSPLQG